MGGPLNGDDARSGEILQLKRALATRDPKREQELAASILDALPGGIRRQVVVVVETRPNGDLIASCTINGTDRTYSVPFPVLSPDKPFLAMFAASLFTVNVRAFLADRAASVPPRGGRP